jgi:hypothetical protein
MQHAWRPSLIMGLFDHLEASPIGKNSTGVPTLARVESQRQRTKGRIFPTGPSLDSRPIRLTIADGGVGAVTVDDGNIRGRVDAGMGNIGDPHVPIRSDGKAMRLGGRMTYRQAHAALCGSPDVARAASVDLANTSHQVRIGAVAAGQGKTRGYWETTVAVERERWVEVLAAPRWREA